MWHAQGAGCCARSSAARSRIGRSHASHSRPSHSSSSMHARSATGSLLHSMLDCLVAHVSLARSTTNCSLRHTRPTSTLRSAAAAAAAPALALHPAHPRPLTRWRLGRAALRPPTTSGLFRFTSSDSSAAARRKPMKRPRHERSPPPTPPAAAAAASATSAHAAASAAAVSPAATPSSPPAQPSSVPLDLAALDCALGMKLLECVRNIKEAQRAKKANKAGKMTEREAWENTSNDVRHLWTHVELSRDSFTGYNALDYLSGAAASVVDVRPLMWQGRRSTRELGHRW